MALAARKKQESHEFKVILGYIGNSRSIWATFNKQTKRKQNRKRWLEADLKDKGMNQQDGLYMRAPLYSRSFFNTNKRA